jgi:hypothetical protein
MTEQNTTPLRKPRASKKEMLAAREARKDHPNRLLLPAMIQERHQLYEERLKAMRAPKNLEKPQRICAGTVPRDQLYNPHADMLLPPVRPGATDHEKHPSRIGAKLVYRDGRKAAA